MRPFKILPVLCLLSGGTYLGFTDAKSFDADLTRIANWIHNGCVLSCVPTDRSMGMHTLRVRVEAPGVKVEARSSYWVGQ